MMTPDLAQPVMFADSIRPELIPASFSHVLAYCDGRFAWPAEQLARFQRHVVISVTGDPAAAEVARELDIERGDAIPAHFAQFATVRHTLGFHDATAYCSIATVPALVGALRNELMHPGLVPWRLHVAWWWEREVPPTRNEVLTELNARYGIKIRPWRVWACQWRNGPDWDTSVLYGADDFTRMPA